MYYSYQNLLQYNAVYNFVIGSRGCGKSYGAKKLVINKFLRQGHQFIYLRRYKTELQKVSTFFDDIRAEFPDHEFKVKGKVFYIDNKIAGWAIPLQTSQIEKQNSYKFVKYIIFDEFLIDNVNQAYKYLKDEYQVLSNFYSTVDRDRDFAVVLFIGNAISMQNPYFDKLKLRPQSKIAVKYGFDQQGKKLALAAIEVFSDPEQTLNARNTRFGSLVSSTDSELDSFMHDNVFYLDDDTLIMDVPNNPRRYSVFMNFTLLGKKYTIIQLKYNQIMLISDYINNKDNVYALVSRDISKDTPYMDDFLRSMLRRILKQYSAYGCLGFSSQSTRAVYFELVKILNIK